MTGSRFFGNHTEQSDYDYFTNDSKEVYHYLRTLGFELSGDLVDLPNYQDKLTRSVLIHKKDNIHIQLVYDAERKIKIQNFIKNNPELLKLLKNTNKLNRSKIWDDANNKLN